MSGNFSHPEKKESRDIMKKMCWKNSHKSFGDLKMGTTDIYNVIEPEKKPLLAGTYAAKYW